MRLPKRASHPDQSRPAGFYALSASAQWMNAPLFARRIQQTKAIGRTSCQPRRNFMRTSMSTGVNFALCPQNADLSFDDRWARTAARRNPSPTCEAIFSDEPKEANIVLARNPCHLRGPARFALESDRRR